MPFVLPLPVPDQLELGVVEEVALSMLGGTLGDIGGVGSGEGWGRGRVMVGAMPSEREWEVEGGAEAEGPLDSVSIED